MTTAKTRIEKKKKYHHGDLRGQLLEAVRQLVERHGPDGWSIAEACRAAGVSTAAPYKHFTDRHDILRAVVLMAMARLGAAMQRAADSHPPKAPERIVALGRAYIDFAHAEPGIFRLMFSMAAGQEADAELTDAGDRASGIVERVVGEFLGIPPESAEARARADALWCFVHGHCFLQLDGKVGPDHLAVPEADFLRFVGTVMLDPTRHMAPS